MLKARDLVRMGLDGHRWGFGFGTTAADGPSGPASTSCWPPSVPTASATRRCRCCPAGSCNGSGSPPRSPPTRRLLLCDEPLAALDLRHQQEVAALLDRRRREHGTAVLFVTHDINAVLDYVDQVLYLAAGQFRLGPPSEVLTSASLTELYGAPVDVLHAQGRLIVVASSDPSTGYHLDEVDHAAGDHSHPDDPRPR